MATPTRREGRPRTIRWTSSWLARLPDDGNRYEALDGALLVTPQAGPAHQALAMRLARLIADYCDDRFQATVVAPGAVVWSENELQPDIQVIPGVLELGSRAKWTDLPLPLLVVEILSPGSERHDCGQKRNAYLGLGIREYWIVDADNGHVLVSRPGFSEPTTVVDTLLWAPSAEIAPLSIDLRGLLSK